VALNALDYLQPENTIPIQVDLYENIRHVYGYECERLDIDLTSTYFEGKECILAVFGYSRDHRSDCPQIVIAFVVDQKGVLVTHRLWPGNQTDAKSLEPIDTCPRDDFGLKAPRVVDRGIATWKNIDYMVKKKERYLVALRAGVKSTGLLEEIGTPKDEWAEIRKDAVAASVTRGRRKYVVAWTASVAEAEKYDGYQVFVTTETDMNEKEVVDSYKIRDEIKKAIQTLKNVLGLHTQYVRTKEHVLGNIFACATAYQLRSILRLKLKESGFDTSV